MDGSAEHTLSGLRDAGLIAVLRSDSARDALGVAQELIAAGIGALEITYTTPNATDVMRELADDDRVLLGAGTITSPQEAEDAAAAGAAFLVSPGSPAALIEAMRDTGLAVVAGALTPTEVMNVLELRVHAIKLFPAVTVGSAYLAQLRGPFPGLRVIPTGGVSAANAGSWLDAGAWALGCGGAVAPRRLADPAAAIDLHARARELLDAIRAARGSRKSQTEGSGRE